MYTYSLLTRYLWQESLLSLTCWQSCALPTSSILGGVCRVTDHTLYLKNIKIYLTTRDLTSINNNFFLISNISANSPPRQWLAGLIARGSYFRQDRHQSSGGRRKRSSPLWGHQQESGWGYPADRISRQEWSVNREKQFPNQQHREKSEWFSCLR